MIPKIIHYCWLSGDPIPNNLQKYMKTWKEKLPDYEFMLWDLSRFNINSSIWVKQAFEKKKYAFAADFIRLYAIYHYGGIYMDMDVEVIKSFNDLLENPYILSFEKEKGIEAGIFGAEKGSLIIKQCLDYYNNKQFIDENGNLDIQPLPSIMYEVLSDVYTIKKRDTHPINFDNKTIYLYSNEYFTAKSYHTGKITQTKNTYTIHHFAGSWIPKSSKAKSLIYKIIRNSTLLFWIYNHSYKIIK
jgi:mannosyltransferase OCH1-like enzyme